MLKVSPRTFDDTTTCRDPSSSTGPDDHGYGCVRTWRRGRGERDGNCAANPRWRDVDVDDLTVLVDRAVNVLPPADDLHVGLIDIPAITDGVSARSGAGAWLAL